MLTGIPRVGGCPRAAPAGRGSELLAGLIQRDAAGRIWAHGRLPAADAFAERHGYLPDRVLWQLRRPAAEAPELPLPPGVALRPFAVGQDEQPGCGSIAGPSRTIPIRAG